MNIHPEVASVVGAVNESHWGQVLLTPHAYGTVQMYAPDGIARQKGVELLTKLTRALSDPPVSLSALELIADDAIHTDVVSMILLVPVGHVMYLVSRGEGAVFLKRGNQLAMLIEHAGAMSGTIQAGDTLIAASSAFVQALSQKDIMGAFDHLPAQEVAENLTMLLHEKGGADGGAALIFHIAETREDSPLPESAQHDSAPPQPIVSGRPMGSVKPIWQTVIRLLRKFINPRQRILLRRAWGSVGSRIREMPKKRLVSTIVIGLFVLSVLFGITHRQATTMSGKTKDVLAQAQHAYDEGMALADLNPLKGRERLMQAKDLLAPLVAKKSRAPGAAEVAQLYALVSDSLTRAMRVTNVAPELFFDVSLLKNGAKASKMALFEQTLGLLDAGGKTVFTLDVKTKRGAVVGGGNALAGAVDIAVYSDALYVLGTSGITRIRFSDQKSTPNAIPKSDEWGNPTSMVAFGGNVYLLDIVKKRIWKYVATESGFSELREYLNPDSFPDLSAATNMVIDGSVWTGSITGIIHHFTQGKEDSYTPQGVEPPLGKNLSVYTGDAAEPVYVLDKDNHRVVVLDKDAMYISQYVWDESFQPTSVVAHEEQGKLLLLGNGKIYSLNLE